MGISTGKYMGSDADLVIPDILVEDASGADLVNPDILVEDAPHELRVHWWLEVYITM